MIICTFILPITSFHNITLGFSGACIFQDKLRLVGIPWLDESQSGDRSYMQTYKITIKPILVSKYICSIILKALECGICKYTKYEYAVVHINLSTMYIDEI